MRPLAIVLAALAVVTACQKPVAEPEKRARLRRTGGTTFELLPAEGQYEHCLAYTVSKRGLTRQLTMSRKNESFHCKPNVPVGGHAYRVPLDEGTVKVYVLFSSIEVNAGSVSQQILDAADRQKLNVMDMRLPGQATLDTLEFTPEEDVPAVVGGELGGDAGVPGAEAPDGGAPAN
jgi:hypothetical protein